MTTLREAHRYMLSTTGTEDTITQALPQLDSTTDALNTAARQTRPQRARRTRPARVKLTWSRLVTEHRSRLRYLPDPVSLRRDHPRPSLTALRPTTQAQRATPSPEEMSR